MICGRLAPSPTGALHLGNAKTFLLAWLSIRSQAGTVVMRIEDLDGPRVKPETVQQAMADLRWLGLDWDFGPDCGGSTGPYIQTERKQIYAAALDQLSRDRLIYPCVCSRSDIERAASAPHPGEEGPRYPGTCRNRFASWEAARDFAHRDPAWRFIVPDGEVSFVDQWRGPMTMDVSSQVGDFVVWKGSGTASYQLAVVVDDAAMNVTEVVRGDDLLSSTPRQLLLYKSLALTPPLFLHVPLVVGPDGLRLAKRHGDTRLATFRDLGVRPERMVGLLAAWSGLVPMGTEVSARELVADFSWERVSRERIVCDRASVERALCS